MLHAVQRDRDAKRKRHAFSKAMGGSAYQRPCSAPLVKDFVARQPSIQVSFLRRCPTKRRTTAVASSPTALRLHRWPGATIMPCLYAMHRIQIYPRRQPQSLGAQGNPASMHKGR